MKKISFQIWRNIHYNKTNLGRFKYWSSMILGLGDEKLSPRASRNQWTKFIILVPEGVSHAKFRIGFYSEKHGICKISNRIRKINDGPFAMRMGPYDCRFFIVGTESIFLQSAGYVRKDLCLY